MHCNGAFSNNSHYSIWFILFWGGFIGSLTHCSTMCSPFVLMQVSDNKIQSMPFLQKLSSFFLLPYHLGRITTYIFLSMVISALSSSFAETIFYQKVMSIFLILSGIVFISKALSKYSLSLFETNYFLRKCGEFLGFLTKTLVKSQDFSSRYFLGFILGFLPCGLVFAALLATASLGGIVNSMIGMLLFSLGTVPVLLVIGGLGRAFILRKISHLLPIAMFLNGTLLLIIAYYKIIT